MINGYCYHLVNVVSSKVTPLSNIDAHKGGAGEPGGVDPIKQLPL